MNNEARGAAADWLIIPKPHLIARSSLKRIAANVLAEDLPYKSSASVISNRVFPIVKLANNKTILIDPGIDEKGGQAQRTSENGLSKLAQHNSEQYEKPSGSTKCSLKLFPKMALR